MKHDVAHQVILYILAASWTPISPFFCSVGILLQTACSSQMSDFPPFTSRPSIHFFEQDFFPRERENSYGHFCADGGTDRQRWMRVVILLASRLYNERETSHVVGRAKIRTLVPTVHVKGNAVRHVIRCSDLMWLWHDEQLRKLGKISRPRSSSRRE